MRGPRTTLRSRLFAHSDWSCEPISFPLSERANTIKSCREWADALEQYGAEDRREPDSEIIWWLRKAAEILESESA